MPDGHAKTAFLGNQAVGDVNSEDKQEYTYENLIRVKLNESLGGTKKVVYPEEKEFYSAIPQAHRRAERAFHVKAFRGSKDGML